MILGACQPAPRANHSAKVDLIRVTAYELRLGRALIPQKFVSSQRVLNSLQRMLEIIRPR